MFGSTNNRVQSRLLRVFLLQLVLISVVTVIGVITASLIVERLLVKKALLGEAEFYWDHRADNADFPLPQTLNLAAYLSSDEQKTVPDSYRKLGLGQHRVDIEGQRQIVHVSERNGERLYLLFDGGTVGNLAFYFGVVPLILVLLTMYGFAFFAYVLSKQAVSPITRLASVIENFDLNKRDANELNLASLDQSSNSETEILANALDHFVQRSSASIERERNFTRYASHELRTPLAVIQGSASSLELLELDGAPARAVQRIKRTSRQMGDLLNTLLILAREEKSSDSDSATPLNVNDLADTLLAQLSVVHSDKNNDSNISHRGQLRVQAPESVLSIVLGNLLGNAFSYTSNGSIQVTVDSNKILVADTGVGMDTNTIDQAFEPFFRADAENGTYQNTGQSDGQHQGLGLAIVKHSCQNYGWEIELESEQGSGTRVTIRF